MLNIRSASVIRPLSLLLALALPALAVAQPCEDATGSVSELVDAVNAAAGEPDPAAKAFFDAFGNAFRTSGRATPAAIDKLVGAAGENADAIRVASLVKHDRELDQDEIAAALE